MARNSTARRLGLFVVGIIFISQLGKVLTDSSDSALASAMEEQKVVPDVLAATPPHSLKVIFGPSTEVKMGNVLTPTQVKDAPQVSWDADTGKFYTLMVVDPDAPSRSNPKFREWQHWIVTNIPGQDISKGETLVAYVGAGPPKGTGLHRYVYIVYEQAGKIAFDEQKLNNQSGSNRGKFSAKGFAAKHKLGNPIAANFYQAEWDDHVPNLFKYYQNNKA